MTESTVLDLVGHAETLAAAVGQAPSLHNAQPWLLRVLPDQVELYADRDRRLPVADPNGRQMHLGLGAALFALRLSVADLRRDFTVRLLPDPAASDLVAVVRVGGRREPTAVESLLLAQLPRRRTVRSAFTGDSVPVPLRVLLGEHAEAEGAGLRWVEIAGERSGVASLVAAGQRRQQIDPDYLTELATWTGPEILAAGAGVPPTAFGPPAGHAGPFPMRDFSGGRDVAPPRPAGPLEDRPVVAVVTTASDTPEDWLAGGQALMRVLLAASGERLASSQLNQPIEVAALRHQLRDELRLTSWPQIVLRLGYPAGPLPPPTPRRPPADVLLP
jgi:nitroreductase